MSITSALASLYEERSRLSGELARVDEAISALEKLELPDAPAKAPKRDGRSAPKPPIDCPFCGSPAKGMAGLAAHVRGSHPDRYPDDYNAWKQQR
jgi:hypothetical protein